STRQYILDTTRGNLFQVFVLQTGYRRSNRRFFPRSVSDYYNFTQCFLSRFHSNRKRAISTDRHFLRDITDETKYQGGIVGCDHLKISIRIGDYTPLSSFHQHIDTGYTASFLIRDPSPAAPAL